MPKLPSWFLESAAHVTSGLPTYLKQIHSPIYNNSKALQTSSGMSIRQIFRCGCFSSGDNLIFIFLASTAFKKTLVISLCYKLAEDAGEYQGHWELPYTASASMARSVTSFVTTCYDGKNNSLWSCTDTWIDQWVLGVNMSTSHAKVNFGQIKDTMYCDLPTATSSQIKPTPHPRTKKLSKVEGDSSVTSNTISTYDVLSSMLYYAGLMACNYLYTKPQLPEKSAALVLKVSALHETITLLNWVISEKSTFLTLCMLYIIRDFIRSYVVKFDTDVKGQELLYKLKEICTTLSNTPESKREEYAWVILPIAREAREIVFKNTAVFYTHAELVIELINLLDTMDEDPYNLRLCNELLYSLSYDLENISLLDTPSTCLLPKEIATRLLKLATKDSLRAISNCATASADELENILSSSPYISPMLRYVQAYYIHMLKLLIVDPTVVIELSENQVSASDEQATHLEFFSSAKRDVNEITAEIQTILECSLEVYQEIFRVLSVLLSCKENSTELFAPERLPALVRICHGTIIGVLLSFYIPSVSNLYMSMSPQLNRMYLVESIIDLITISGKISSIYSTYYSQVQDGKQFPCYKSLDHFFSSPHSNLPDPKIIEICRKGEKVLESIHPLRDDYKFRESATIPGSKYLYLRFDHRCSTQLADSDIVMIYSGRGANQKKVAEYGGNMHGFGSRPIGGLAWPKELIRIEGDIVTVHYEQRSRREGSVPSKVMWGFTIHVYGHDFISECKLPIFIDHFLGSINIISEFLEEMYYGVDENDDELNASGIFKLPFLQECNLSVENLDVENYKQANQMISEKTIRKMMKVLGKPLPLFRASIAELIQPMLLIGNILSIAEKHFDINFLDILKPGPIDEAEMELCSFVFMKIYSFLRKLQSVANLESNWRLAVEDMLKLPQEEVQMPFFVDLSESDASFEEFQLICQIKGVSLKSSDSNDVISAVFKLQEILFAEVKHLKGESLVDTPPNLTPVEETVKEKPANEQLDVASSENLQPVAEQLPKPGIEIEAPPQPEVPDTSTSQIENIPPSEQDPVTESAVSNIEQSSLVTENQTQLDNDKTQIVESTDVQQSQPEPLLEQIPASLDNNIATQIIDDTSSPTSEIKSAQKEEAALVLPPDPFAKTKEIVKITSDKLSLLHKIEPSFLFGEKYRRSKSKKDLLEEFEDNAPLLTVPTFTRARAVSVPHDNIKENRDAKHKTTCTPTDITQLFTYLSFTINTSVTAQTLIKASKHCHNRAKSRLLAFQCIQHLLQLSKDLGWGPLPVSFIIRWLGEGTMQEELFGSGMFCAVKELYRKTFFEAVSICISKPLLYAKCSIYLCITPCHDIGNFEDTVLIQSKLIKTLDLLLSLEPMQRTTSVQGMLQDQLSAPTDELSDKKISKIASLAWGALQCLSLQYIYKSDKDKLITKSSVEALAQQLSHLLDNHLERTMNQMTVDEVKATKMLFAILSLLLKLVERSFGKMLIAKPSLVSKLLILLLDHRPSPRLVYLTLQLCRNLLPLFSEKDCADIVLPDYSLSFSFSTTFTQEEILNESLDSSLLRKTAESNASRIIKLFLLKLGDFIVPDITYAGQEQEENISEEIVITNPEDESEEDDNRLTVYVHRRRGEDARNALPLPIFQPENFEGQLSGLPFNPARLLNLVTALKDNTRAEYCSTSKTQSMRNAQRLAGKNFLVSIGNPLTGKPTSHGGYDLKRQQSYDQCRIKNDLLKKDPLRPFISGQVAVSMAQEIITMLHSLSISKAQAWVSAIKEVISDTLITVPHLINHIYTLCNNIHKSAEKGQYLPRLPIQHFTDMKPLAAVLVILGGFKESIHQKALVRVRNTDCQTDTGIVKQVLEHQSQALVILQHEIEGSVHVPKDPLMIPEARLIPSSMQFLELDKLDMSEELINCLVFILSKQSVDVGTVSPSIDASGPQYALCRLFNEIRTKAVLLFSRLANNYTTAKIILEKHPACLDQLLEVSRQCNPGDRQFSLEKQVLQLRLLYRDCARPPAPPITIKKTIERKNLFWDIERPYPRVSGVIMSNGLNKADVIIDPTTIPKEQCLRMYASEPLPPLTPSFYWELELLHPVSDMGQENILYMGYAPQEVPVPDQDEWKFPAGACLLSTTGQVVKTTIEKGLKNIIHFLYKSLTGRDTIGMGWIRERNKSLNGYIYITVNGEKLDMTIKNVPEGLFPCVYVMKKTKFFANFGTRNFAYAPGHHHRDAALNLRSAASTEDIIRGFQALPFANLTSDSDSDIEESHPSNIAIIEDKRPIITEIEPEGVELITPGTAESVEYYPKLFYHYDLPQSLDEMIWIGPGGRVGLGDDLDKREAPDDERDKHIKLLVKAWEERVFPALDRRFRNDNERRMGREYILGALQQGNTEFAVMIAESLYEHEPHTRPQNLRYPTTDEIKLEAEKLNIKVVQKNNIVVIKKTSSEGGAFKFYTKGMKKTFGLTGIVLAKEESTNLVQVETYLENEGLLVRYWYPLDILEKPPKGARKSNSPVLRSQAMNIYMHRALIKSELSLTYKYCQNALVNLLGFTELRLNMCPPPNFTLLPVPNETLISRITYLKHFSYHSLSNPLPDSTQIPWSGLNSMQPSDCLDALNVNVSTLFYENAKEICDIIKYLIHEAIKDGSLDSLSSNICSCLTQSNSFLKKILVPITTTKESVDVEIPGVSSLYILCKHVSDGKIKKEEVLDWTCSSCTLTNLSTQAKCQICSTPKPAPKPSTSTANICDSPNVVISSVDGPWVRVFVYRGHPTAHKPPKNPTTLCEIVRYPNLLFKDITIQPYCGSKFPILLIPGNKIHLHMCAIEDPGASVEITGIHPDFPLAIVFIQILSSVIRSKNSSMKANLAAKQDNKDSLFDSTEKMSQQSHQFDSPSSQAPLTKDEQLEILDAITLANEDERRLELGEESDMFTSSIEPIEKYEDLTTLDMLPLIKQCIEWITSFLHESASPIPVREILFNLLSEVMRNTMTLDPLVIGSIVGLEGKLSCLHDEIQELFDKEVKLIYRKGSTPSADDLKNIHISKLINRGGSGKFSTYFQSLLNLVVTIDEVQKSQNRSERDFSGDPRQRPRGRRPKKPLGTDKKLSLEKPKSKTDSWLNTIYNHIHTLDELNSPRYSEHLQKIVFESSKQALNLETHKRLLVITGLNPNIPPEKVSNVIKSLAIAHGGMTNDDLYLPYRKTTKIEVAKIPKLDPTTTDEGLENEAKGKDEKQIESPEQQTPTSSPTKKQTSSPKADTAEVHSKSEDPKIISREVIELFGLAIFELQFSSKAALMREALLEELPKLTPPTEAEAPPQISVSLPTNSFNMGEDQKANDALEKYCKFKLISDDRKELKHQVKQALIQIFLSCITPECRSATVSEKGTKEKVYKQNILNNERHDNLLFKFFDVIRGKPPIGEYLNRIFRRWDITKEGTINLVAFKNLTGDLIKKDIKTLARGLAVCGYSLTGECLGEIATDDTFIDWTQEMDEALIGFVNYLCRSLSISPARLRLTEIWKTPILMANPDFQILMKVSYPTLRTRFAMLYKINSIMVDLVPFADFRTCDSDPDCLSSKLLINKKLMFYDYKTKLLENLLRSSARRVTGVDAPVIDINPLEDLDASKTCPWSSQLYQAIKQLKNTPSPQLCVDLRQVGGEPTYAFSVKMPSVHGNAGSFRDFICKMVTEAKSSSLSIFIQCPSAALGFHIDKFILNPASMTYIEEIIVQYLGMFIGLSIRANIPLPLDLMPAFWKQFLGIALDITDLYDIDRTYYNMCRNLAQAETAEIFYAMLSEDTEESSLEYKITDSPLQVEISPEDRKPSELHTLMRKSISKDVAPEFLYGDRDKYFGIMIQDKLKEYTCVRKMNAIRCGFASVIPLHLIQIFTHLELEMKICGSPHVEIDFLKKHTKYSVGLLESDKHIEFFWQVLRGFSQDELSKFIKFACNLERIPSECPCSQGGEDIVHTPPFPMIIAAPDSKGNNNQDERFIRAETCIFQIKLPQYTSIEVMRDHLLYAINARRDPLWDDQ